MTANMKNAFLVPFFGELPPYFGFWAKSCEINHENFHWFVYNDRTHSRQNLNRAVTLIPYQFDEMTADFRDILDIRIPGHHIRNVCDYRIMFHFLRRKRECLDDFDFVGYTDMDMIYGRLKAFLPRNMRDYSMISADDDEPCGPFTLINRVCMKALPESGEIREHMESPEHESFNESRELMKLVSQEKPALCRTAPLQPARTPGFNFRRSFAIWDDGRVEVRDNRGNRREGGFYHFSRHKDKKRFRIRPEAIEHKQWAVHKYGITGLHSKMSRLRLRLSLIV